MTYKDDLLHGLYRIYDVAGMMKQMLVYRNGMQVDEDPNSKVKLEIKRDYHPNARVKSSVTLRDGLKEGVYREYDQEGKITAARIFVRDIPITDGIVDEGGKEQGAWKFFYEDGQLKAEGKYENGKREGEWKFYYKGKKIQQTGTYKANQPVGEWKWYYPNGQILREQSFVKGKEEGLTKEYSEDGTLVAEGEYLGGMREGDWKYKNGEYIAKGKYVDGKEQGEWKQYYPSGTLAFEGSYVDGLENGYHRYYFSEGRIKEERYYRMGLKDGLWKIFDENSDLIVTTNYAAGEIQKIDGVKISAEKKEE
jgi:antitoxin component YwqK of YwqJK toxin-antitoxin module